MNRPIAFDVGANNGHDTARLLEEGYVVHSFEPITEMCDHIRNRMKGKWVEGYDVFINEIGVICYTKEGPVGEWKGIPCLELAEFYVSKGHDWGTSSLLKLNKDLAPWDNPEDLRVDEVRPIKVVRMDDYCEALQIKKVDYIHIDA